jgi:steroid 5-alpha reductase family enzyme
MAEPVTLFFSVALIVWAHASIWFFIAHYQKRNDVADVAWGLGFCAVCIFLLYAQPYGHITLLLCSLVIAWGVRLSLHIHRRNSGKPEDYRYRQMREGWGKNVVINAYLKVFVLQGIFLLLIISPLVWASGYPETTWSTWTTLGVTGWILGFVFQAVGDAQLAAFVKTKKPGEIIQSGLWKYSRHPNYFGEIVMWWSIFLVTVPVEGSLYFVVGPLTITVLLAFVSGVPMLEAKYTDNPAFQEYKKRTSALVPWWPKRRGG